jgi:hypothetical protein
MSFESMARRCARYAGRANRSVRWQPSKRARHGRHVAQAAAPVLKIHRPTRRACRAFGAAALAARDAETIRAFIEWNQPRRLARILTATAELARPVQAHVLPQGAAGPVYVPALVARAANLQVALMFLCELTDAAAALRFNAEVRRYGINGLVGVA